MFDNNYINCYVNAVEHSIGTQAAKGKLKSRVYFGAHNEKSLQEKARTTKHGAPERGHQLQSCRH